MFEFSPSREKELASAWGHPVIDSGGRGSRSWSPLEANRPFSDTPHPLGFLDHKFYFSKLPFFPSQVLGYVLSGAVFVEHPGWRLAFVGAQGLASSLQREPTVLDLLPVALPVLGSWQGQPCGASSPDRAPCDFSLVLTPGREPLGWRRRCRADICAWIMAGAAGQAAERCSCGFAGGPSRVWP